MYKQTEVLNQTLYLQAFKASAHLLSMHVYISLYVTVLYFTQNQFVIMVSLCFGRKAFQLSHPTTLKKVSPLQQYRKQHQSLHTSYRQRAHCNVNGSLRHKPISVHLSRKQKQYQKLTLHHQNASESTKHCKIFSRTKLIPELSHVTNADLRDRGAVLTMCTTCENMEGWGHTENRQTLLQLFIYTHLQHAYGAKVFPEERKIKILF